MRFDIKKKTPRKGNMKSADRPSSKQTKEWSENKQLSVLLESVSWCEKRHKGAKTARKKAHKRIMATELKIRGLFLVNFLYRVLFIQ